MIEKQTGWKKRNLIIGVVAAVIIVSLIGVFSSNYLNDQNENIFTGAEIQNPTTPPGQSAPSSVIIASGDTLLTKNINSDDIVTLQYEFTYPARIGYVLDFEDDVSFEIHSSTRSRVFKKNVAQLTDKFDVNEGDPGVFTFRFNPKGAGVNGQFTLIEIAKFNV